jgi:hydroxymethylbilane synthase
VHSFKDVPTNLPCETLVISGVLKRQNPLDALVVSDILDAEFKNVENLDQFFKLCETAGKLPVSIGTSSLRRRAQLKAKYNDKVKISDIRGNLNTRLRKLDSPKEGEPVFDAIILATAGLERLGVEFHERITVRIAPEDMLYAVGQAALAIESRANDSDCLKIIQSISDEVSNFETICERACMRTLEGGCHVPIGVNTVRDEAGKMTVTCAVFSIDGTKTASVTQSCSIVEVNKQTSGLIHGTFCDNFEQGTAIDKMGSDMADKLLIAGAKEILNPTVE